MLPRSRSARCDFTLAEGRALRLADRSRSLRRRYRPFIELDPRHLVLEGKLQPLCHAVDACGVGQDQHQSAERSRQVATRLLAGVPSEFMSTARRCQPHYTLDD